MGDPMPLMLKQTGFSSSEELDAAMKRYHAYCESLPESAPIPTFMEYLGRPNLATERQKKIRAELQGRDFSDQSELEAYIDSYTQQENSASLEHFEQLSPAQMHRILTQEFRDNGWLVGFREDLPDAAGVSAPIVDLMRWLLQYYIDKDGEFRLTGNGYYPRALCRRYLERYDTLYKEGDSVPSEATMPLLSSAHDLLCELEYIGETRTSSSITTEGVRILHRGAWAEAFRSAFETAIDHLDWLKSLSEEIQYQHFEIIQDSAPFLLFLLKKYPFGSVDDLFARFCRAFPPFGAPAQADARALDWLQPIFSILFVANFCLPFGLLDLSDGDRYRTTELFHQALRWNVPT